MLDDLVNYLSLFSVIQQLLAFICCQEFLFLDSESWQPVKCIFVERNCSSFFVVYVIIVV